MSYQKAQLMFPQVVTVNGSPAQGYVLYSYVWDTSTPLSMYTSSTGSGAATSFSLNSLGITQTSGGTVCDIFLDSSKTYKFILKDASGVQVGPTIGPVYGSGTELSVIQTCNTVAEMKALTSLIDGQLIRTLGYHQIGDKGHGEYIFMESSTETATGFLVHQPDIGSGRFILQLRDGMYNVRQAGAVGDGVTDDTDAFQLCINSLPAVNDPEYDAIGGGTVYVPGNDTYRVQNITVGSLVEITGDGYGTVIKQLTASGALITLGVDDVSRSDLCQHIRLRRMTLLGVATQYVEGNHGVHGFSAFRHFHDDLRIMYFGDNGHHLRGASYTYLRGSYVELNYGAGIFWHQFNSTTQYVTASYVIGCTIRVNNGPGIWLKNTTERVGAIDCTIESNGLTPQKILPGTDFESPDEYVMNVYLEDTTHCNVFDCVFEQTSSFPEEKVQIVITGYINEISRNMFANATGVICYRGGDSPASYNRIIGNIFNSSVPDNLKMIFSTDSGVQPVQNSVFNNSGADIHEQASSLSNEYSVAGYSDKLVSYRQDKVSSGSGISLDCGLRTAVGLAIDTGYPKGNTFFITLQANTVIPLPTNVSEGEEVTFVLIQDATGGRTVSWNGQFKHAWSDSGNTANKRSSITFKKYAPNFWQIGAQSPYY